MTVHFHFAWDFARFESPYKVTVDESGGGTATITYATGVYAHAWADAKNIYDAGWGAGAIDVTAIRFPYEPSSSTTPSQGWAGKLVTDLNAAAGLAGTYGVSAYTGTRITITANTSFRFASVAGQRDGCELLGFTHNLSYASTRTSDFDMWFSIAGDAGNISNIDEDHEPSEIAVDGETDDMLSAGVAWTAPPQYMDFTLAMEPPEAVLRRASDLYVPTGGTVSGRWSWQHAWRHARNVHSFMVAIDPTYVASTQAISAALRCSTHRFRADGAGFRAVRSTADWDGRWDLHFRTRVLERSRDNFT